MLGVQFQPHDKGAEIVGVSTDSPAQAAGLQAGDIVTAVDAQPVGGVIDNIRPLLAPALQTGANIKLDILRKAEKLTITVTPRKR